MRNGVAGIGQVVGGFDKWVKEEKLSPASRKYHQRTWLRATEVALASVSLALVAATAQRDERELNDARDAARYRAMKANDFSLEYSQHVDATLNERKGIDLDAAIDRLLDDSDE